MPRSAAQSLYRHLPSAEREPVQQRTPNVADAMWPQLSREVKAHDAQYQRDKESLIRNLREARLAMEALRRPPRREGRK